MKRFTLISPLLACFISGCVLQTDVPELPEQDIPDSFQGPVVAGSQIWPSEDWWNEFNDDELAGIITLVQENNLDLANNRRNLEAAQISLRDAGFDLLPTPVVNVSTGAGYFQSRSDADNVQIINNQPGNNTGSNSSNIIESGDRSGSINQPFDLRGGFNYNDILSKPYTYERAVADYDSRVAQVADVQLNTLGTAASTYFQILLTRDKVVAAEQNVENAEAIGEIANARVEAGVAVPIEALQQQIAIERERANLRSLVQNDLSARASLALLAGQSVQNFNVQGQTLQSIQIPQVQPGLPSELLFRRPDLVQAEANLRGAAADVDILRTDFFPQISLTGGASASSSSLSQVISSPDTFLNINANLLQTLLDNGQRSRNVAQARLSMENSLAIYRRTVIDAFNEVDVLLSNIQLLQQLGDVAARNLDAAEESFRIAQVRYEEGVADFLTVLQSQNTLFSTRNAFLDNKLLQLNAMVGLYQALGGGWEAESAQ